MVSMEKPGQNVPGPRNPYEAHPYVETDPAPQQIPLKPVTDPAELPWNFDTAMPLLALPVNPEVILGAYLELLRRQMPLVMLPLPPNMFGMSSGPYLASASILGTVADITSPRRDTFASLKAFRQGATAARTQGLHNGSLGRGIDKRLQLVDSTPASSTTPQQPTMPLSPEAAGQFLDRLASYATGNPSDPVASTDETDSAS